MYGAIDRVRLCRYLTYPQKFGAPESDWMAHVALDSALE